MLLFFALNHTRGQCMQEEKTVYFAPREDGYFNRLRRIRHCLSGVINQVSLSLPNQTDATGSFFTIKFRTNPMFTNRCKTAI